MIRRLVDVVLASLALAISLPILVLAGLAIKLVSPGSALFRAPRSGKDGRPFTMYKLRTMHARPADRQSRITGAHDLRVFPLGRLLRRLKVDELPQLVNVLIGDMAIIGPRPEDPYIVSRHYTPGQRRTLAVRPGLSSPGSLFHETHCTGLVDGTDPERAYLERVLPLKLAIDLVYVRRASLPYDLAIIGRTITVIVSRLCGRRRFPDPPELAEARQWLTGTPPASAKDANHSDAPVTARRLAPDELGGWDELVGRFPHHHVTQTRAWMQSLESAGYGTPAYFVFERGGQPVGCLPGLLAAIGPYRLFGSPRAGWETGCIGPAFDPARLSTAELMAALVPLLENDLGIHHIDLLTDLLDPEAMRAAGFRGESVPTTRARLFPDDPNRTFKAFAAGARQNIRRAQRLGLEVRFGAGPQFIGDHYDQLREVYARNGRAITFSKDRIRACLAHLPSPGTVIAASVHLPESPVSIATGIFLVHQGELSLWMWAHRSHYRWYRPTELMTWAVVQEAIARGCATFDLAGRGQFKTKFGGSLDLTPWRWTWSRPQWLEQGRRLVRAGFQVQQVVRGRIARLGAAGEEPTAREARRPPAWTVGDVDVVRALGLAGIRSVVVAPARDPARFSRHACRRLPWPDPIDDAGPVVQSLISAAQREPEPPVLIYSDDQTLLLLARHRERLSRAFRFVLPRSELVEDLVDKGRFQALAIRLGLPVPPARVFDPSGEPAPNENAGLSFPLVIKPVVRQMTRWRSVAGEKKALRASDPAELRSIWPALRGAGPQVLLQSLIPGTEQAIESYHVYMDGAGSLVAEFTGRKIRTWPAEFGSSTALEITEAPDVLQAGREIVRRLGFTGVAKLDFKRGPDGQLHLLEVNPRFSLWHHLGARAGVNIPALVYGDLLGRPRPPAARARPGVRWCRLWADREAAVAGGIPVRSWLPWALSCQAKRAFAWDDPAPLLLGAAVRGLARFESIESPAIESDRVPVAVRWANDQGETP